MIESFLTQNHKTNNQLLLEQNMDLLHLIEISKNFLNLKDKITTYMIKNPIFISKEITVIIQYLIKVINNSENPQKKTKILYLLANFIFDSNNKEKNLIDKIINIFKNEKINDQIIMKHFKKILEIYKAQNDYLKDLTEQDLTIKK